MFLQIVAAIFAILYFYFQFFWGRGFKTIEVNEQGVLITGCDTGFGFELAKRLDELGFTVFAGCLDDSSEGATKLKDTCSDRVHVVPMDVTKSEAIRKVRTYIEKIHEEIGCGLWGLVNNAGIDTFGDIEFCTMDMYRQVAEVNLFGMINVTKTFLPLIRKYKGRIVNVTGVKGLLHLPRTSAFSVTSHAAENFSNCLRLEIRKFGVKVMVIEPGQYGSCTGIYKDKNFRRLEEEKDEMWEKAEQEIKETYGKEYLDAQLEYQANIRQTSYPICDPVVEAMVDALINIYPAYRYLIGGGREWLDRLCIFGQLQSYISTRWMDIILLRWSEFQVPKIKSFQKL